MEPCCFHKPVYLASVPNSRYIASALVLRLFLHSRVHMAVFLARYILPNLFPISPTLWLRNSMSSEVSLHSLLSNKLLSYVLSSVLPLLYFIRGLEIIQLE